MTALRHFCLLIFCFFAIQVASAQVSSPADSTVTPLPSDTSGIAADSTVAADTLQPTGDIKTTINYSARDSIRFNVRTQEIYLYGDAKIEYGDITLKADTIEINWANNTLTARGGVDSTGRTIGTPEFTEGADNYVAENIRYNFVSRKGIISGIVTQQGEGYIHGERVKKNELDELFIRRAKYTTCNLPDPHFEISAPKIKVIPGDKLISGPFNLVIADIPTPLGFAFGMFPTPRTRSSGIVMPVYGEADTRGFFLRDGGYYWAVSDYLGLQFLGNIYTKGSWGLSTQGTYRKRYAYSGSFNLRFNNTKSGTEGLEDTRKEFWVNWSHSPQTRKNGRFAVSINAGSSSFNTLNSFSTDAYLSNAFNSSISYSNRFSIGQAQFNYGVNLRQSQNTSTGTVNFTLPDINLGMNRIYPFAPAGSAPKNWLQKIGLSYNFTATNRISNEIPKDIYAFDNIITPDEVSVDEVRQPNIPFNFQNLPTILSNAQAGARHTIPVSTSFSLFNYINVSPSLNYEEVWFLKRQVYTWNAVDDTLNARTEQGFYRAYSGSASLGFSTRLYGMYRFGSGNGKVQAIRHVINPSLSLGYRPDFSDPVFGIYQQDVQIDRAGTLQRVNPFLGSVYSAPAAGKSGSVSFSLNNNLEMKVREENDTAQTFKKVSLLDNFGISTSYNLAADSFALSPINWNARTRILGQIDINISGTIDPYQYAILDQRDGVVTRQRRVNAYAFDWKSRKFGQLSRTTVSLSTNLNPQALKREQQTREALDEARTPENNEEINRIQQNPDQYVDFNIPWSFRVSYNLSYSRVGYFDSSVRQSLSFSGDLSITEKWKLSFTSAYDFEAKDFGFTTISINRDLHCWTMAFNWIPFGQRQSYTFDLRAQASLLQDLKLSRRRSWYDR
ncbi:putative LPS assembly protein LptD [Catalinimonas alkaloidigena]|uniref:putative LPS assembly protein LptD n=1 Tax=Catalinimonas alkaloidigena TaxID=1075417 RepID=UPI00115FFBD1|nr:putative LPS assembly protein LptD [Catalinimonas alkaloidigena]